MAALKSAYFNALNESLKDELATLDEPATLEDLTSQIISLDNRIHSRARERSQRNQPVKLLGGITPAPVVSPS